MREHDAGPRQRGAEDPGRGGALLQLHRGVLRLPPHTEGVLGWAGSTLCVCAGSKSVTFIILLYKSKIIGQSHSNNNTE